MKRTAVIFEKPFAVSVVEEPLQEAEAGQVLVQNRMSAISPGTELLIYRGLVPDGWPVDSTISSLAGTFGYPIRYGYTALGQVVDAGPGVDPSWIGRWVFSFQPHQSHYLASPLTLIPLPTDLNPENALFVPAMETAVNFMMDGKPVIGERVMVLGQGIVGLLTTGLLSRFPLSELVTFDRYAYRRQRSLEVGAHRALDPFNRGNIGDPDHIIDAEGLQGKADLVYELSGDPATLNQAVSFCGFGARIIVGSWYGTRRAALDLGRAFHRNRIRLISSQVSTIAPEMSGRWSKERRLAVVWDMIRNVRPDKLITHRFPVEKAQQAYDMLDRQPESAVQVVLTYGNSPSEER